MSRRTYSSSNSWAQNISAIIHRTEANIASIRQQVPTTLVSPASPYTKEIQNTQRVYHYAPQISYSGGRWAQPVIHTQQRCYTPTIKGMSHIQDNCPECANPMTEMSGQNGGGGAHHNRSYFTLQHQPSRPFTERPQDIDSTSHIYVRNVIEGEIDPRARSVASFKNQHTLDEPEHPLEKTPLKGILRQSAFSEKAAAQSNLESMAQIFTKLQDLKYEQQSVVDKYEIGQKGLRNQILDLRNDIELNQLQKIEDKISETKSEIKKDIRGIENKMLTLQRAMTELKMDIDSKLDTEFHRALADFQAKSGEERIKLRRDILDVMEEKVSSTEQKQLLNNKDNENANSQLKQRIKKLEESMTEQVQENHRSAMDKIDMIRLEMQNRGVKEATTITSEKEETMIQLEAMKREIARLNKKVANVKPVRDELALSRQKQMQDQNGGLLRKVVSY